MYKALCIVASITAISVVSAVTHTVLTTYKPMINNYLVSKLAKGTDARSNLEQAFKWLSSFNDEDKLNVGVLKLHNTLLDGKKLVDSPSCNSDEVMSLNDLSLLRYTQLSPRYQRIDKVADYILDGHSDKCRSLLTLRISHYMDKLGKESPTDKESLLSMARRMRSDANRYADIVEAAYAAITTHVDDPIVASILQRTTPKHLAPEQLELIYSKYVLEPCMRMDITSKDLWRELELDEALSSSIFDKEFDLSLADFSYAHKACDRFIDDAYVAGSGPISGYTRKRSNLIENVKETMESKTGTRITRSFFRL